jgi:hypothetical protein
MIEPETQSTFQRHASYVLDEPVAEWIRRRRAQGATWKVIGRDLRDRTGGKLDVSEKTLRLWAAQ